MIRSVRPPEAFYHVRGGWTHEGWSVEYPGYPGAGVYLNGVRVGTLSSPITFEMWYSERDYRGRVTGVNIEYLVHPHT